MERALQNYVTKEEQVMELRDKASLSLIDEVKDNLDKLRAINVESTEQLAHKFEVLKEDFEAKTKEMMDNMEDMNKKIDEFDEGSEYDEESDQDLDSELGDTLDANAMDKDAFKRAGDD